MGVVGYSETGRTANVNEKGERTYTRKFQVRMAHTDDSPPAVWVDGPPILRDDPFPGDVGARALSLDVSNSGDNLGLFYEITYHYSSKATDKGNTSQDKAKQDQSKEQPGQVPDRPWTVKFSGVHKTRLLAPQDIAGRAVVNSANQPFNPAVEVPTSNMLMTCEGFKDATIFDPISKANAFLDAVNDEEWQPFPVGPLAVWIFPAKTCKVNEYSSDYQKENGVGLYKITIAIEVSFRKPWNPISVLDAGTLEKNHGDPAQPPRPILDPKTGQPIQSPVPLNGDGIVLPWNAPALVYLDFKGYFEVPFRALLA